MSRNLKVAVVQHSNSADYPDNLEKSIAGIRRAAAQGRTIGDVAGTAYRPVFLSGGKHRLF